MTILLKSAVIIDKNSPFHKQKKDILISEGKIKQIDDTITNKTSYKVVNFKNLHVSCGWFDTSVSFGEPGFEDRETIENGLKVAGKSGFTSVAINPNTQPINDTKSGIEFIKNRGVNNPVNIYPIGALTQKSEGNEMAELFDMQQHGAIAFGDYKKPIENDNLLKIALLYAQNFDGLVLSFPKNNKIAQNGVANEGINSTKLGLKGIPNLAEEIQIVRDLFLLEYTGGKLHIPTISSEKSVELIKKAKVDGLKVTCSVAAHNLILTDDELHEFDSSFKVSPPLRTEKDRKALVKGVKNGTIDIITSDHNPIKIENKKVEFSIAESGTIGLESLFGALNSVLDVETIITCLTENPKNIFGIPNTQINVGEQANLSLFTTDGSYTFSDKNVFSASKNSIFFNKQLKGKALGILNNDMLILNE